MCSIPICLTRIRRITVGEAEQRRTVAETRPSDNISRATGQKSRRAAGVCVLCDCYRVKTQIGSAAAAENRHNNIVFFPYLRRQTIIARFIPSRCPTPARPWRGTLVGNKPRYYYCYRVPSRPLSSRGAPRKVKVPANIIIHVKRVHTCTRNIRVRMCTRIHDVFAVFFPLFEVRDNVAAAEEEG